MLRLSADDPLALSLFTPAELKGLRHLQRRKRGKRAGELTDEQLIELGFEARGIQRGWQASPVPAVEIAEADL